MHLPESLSAWLSVQGYGAIEKATEITGGCINMACSLETESGDKLFIKYQHTAPSFFFESEADALSFIKMACNLRVPRVIGFTDDFLALEYIASSEPSHQFWEVLGQQLATLHSCERGRFGFINDNYCGRTLQSNTYYEDGHDFFLQERLLPLAKQALDQGQFNLSDLEKLERLGQRLNNLIPQQEASLLHGDFWSGNVHIGDCGEPVFIDPAVYFGWAEIDIAMTQLFGGFPDRFYRAYMESRPMEADWESRLSIYNLYPLLNHLIMFGQGYKAQIIDILDRYQ